LPSSADISPSRRRSAGSLLPTATRPRLVAAKPKLTHAVLDEFESALMFVPASRARESLGKLPFAPLLQGQFDRAERSAGSHFTCSVPNKSHTTVAVGLVADAVTPFALLELAGSMVKSLRLNEARVLGLACAGLSPTVERQCIDAGAAAGWAGAFGLPTFKSKATPPHHLARIVPVTRQAIDARRATAVAEGTDLVRWLTALPPDRLDPSGFKRLAQTLARRHGLRTRFYGEAELKRLGAGAFLAVTRGSPRRNAGILHLRYQPRTRGKRKTGPIALLGKGLCFDTGGTNLKSHKSMLDMHTDMGGSAVALATLLALAEMRYPRPVDAWLAIAENRIGPDAYQPQDVVTAMNGTTIQVIHTDAEGRMVLADTLALASRSKPAAIIDFATLTGSCVTALTDRYSGAFTNRPDWHDPVIVAGRQSGERVWCMPMDEDFDHELESKVADVVQCTVDGKGDHIYAARFLQRFVGKGIPWLHVDLSAATRSGGLAHVPGDITGFGVRFAVSLLLDQELPAAGGDR
jgi:leucyl aminopeptidase